MAVNMNGIHTVLSSPARSLFALTGPPTLVQGCIQLGGSCSSSLQCCIPQADHQYVGYDTPPAPTVANMFLTGTSAQQRVSARMSPARRLRFTGQPASESEPAPNKSSVNTATDSVPAPMGVRAMGYNRPGGYEAFHRLLDNCGDDISLCANCEQSSITKEGLMLDVKQRSHLVAGQTRPPGASFLGTYFRSADINDVGMLRGRGAFWGTSELDIEADRNGILGGAPLGSDRGASQSENNAAEGRYFNASGPAYYNRWYHNQTKNPGTPLWPSGAKSEFGVCCAYHYATFGTNGYRATTAGTPYVMSTTTSAELKGNSANDYNMYSANGIRSSLTTPPFPEAYVDKLNMCYRDGPPLRAVAPNTTADTGPGDICRVGDPNLQNVVPMGDVEQRTSAPWKGWAHVLLDHDSQIVATTQVEDNMAFPGMDSSSALGQSAITPYYPGHASCAVGTTASTNIRVPKSATTAYLNLDAEEWDPAHSIKRSFVPPIITGATNQTPWNGSAESNPLYQQIKRDVYRGTFKSRQMCEGLERPTRWFHSMVRGASVGTVRAKTPCSDYKCRKTQHSSDDPDNVGDPITNTCPSNNGMIPMAIAGLPEMMDNAGLLTHII